MSTRRDFLHEIVDERSKRNPEFADLVQAALERRVARRERAEAARDQRLTGCASEKSATD